MEEGFSGDFSNQTEDLQAGLMGILLCRYEESQWGVVAEIRSEDEGEKASSIEWGEGWGPVKVGCFLTFLVENQSKKKGK